MFDESQCDNINPSLTNRCILCEKAVSGLVSMLDICQCTWVGALSAEIYWNNVETALNKTKSKYILKLYWSLIVFYLILFDGLPWYISRLSHDNFTVVLLLSIKHKINRTFVCFSVRSMIFHLVNTERSISLVAAPLVKYHVKVFTRWNISRSYTETYKYPLYLIIIQ